MDGAERDVDVVRSFFKSLEPVFSFFGDSGEVFFVGELAETVMRDFVDDVVLSRFKVFITEP